MSGSRCPRAPLGWRYAASACGVPQVGARGSWFLLPPCPQATTSSAYRWSGVGMWNPAPTPGLIRRPVAPTPGVGPRRRRPTDSRFLYRTLREVGQLPVRGYVRLEGGRWRSMTDLRPVAARWSAGLAASRSPDPQRRSERPGQREAQREALELAEWRGRRDPGSGRLVFPRATRHRWREPFWDSRSIRSLPRSSSHRWKPGPATGWRCMPSWVAAGRGGRPCSGDRRAGSPGDRRRRGPVALALSRRLQRAELPILGRGDRQLAARRGGFGARSRQAGSGGGAERPPGHLRMAGCRGSRAQMVSWSSGSEGPPGSPEVPHSDTLHFDGGGRAWLSPGEYRYRLSGGGDGTVAVEEYTDELLPRAVSPSPMRGGAQSGARTTARDWLWLFGVCVLALSGEWLARRRLGLR